MVSENREVIGSSPGLVLCKAIFYQCCSPRAEVAVWRSILRECCAATHATRLFPPTTRLQPRILDVHSVAELYERCRPSATTAGPGRRPTEPQLVASDRDRAGRELYRQWPPGSWSRCECLHFHATDCVETCASSRGKALCS